MTHPLFSFLKIFFFKGARYGDGIASINEALSCLFYVVLSH
jgi:hypothetical protein